MNHIVMFSGGVASWAAAKLVAERHGTENLTLLFCDTSMEDEDLYRFLGEAAANVGGKLVHLCDGRNPWEAFRDTGMLSHHPAKCSQVLKGNVADKWIAERFTPETCVRYVGIDWTEIHRLDLLRDHLAPWRVEAPLCDAPMIDKRAAFAWLAREGIAMPRLYAMGFSHNNCGGFCVRAGQAHFALLLRKMPDRYRWHEEQEAKLRETLGDGAFILRDRRGGKTRPLTLRAFRERLEGGGAGSLFDANDVGGCGCFVGDGERAAS